MAELLPRPCPICGKPPSPRFRPFCSGRCADVDLQSWLTGRYAIPVPPDESDEADAFDGTPPDSAVRGRPSDA